MKKTTCTKEEIENEIAELEADQHLNFFKNEPKGRKRMSDLLLELNMMDENGVHDHNISLLIMPFF